MRIFKRARVAAELQHDYGFTANAARDSGTASKVLPKRWNKCELAAFIAVSSIASEGMKAGDKLYMQYCEQMVASKFSQGKLRLEFYCGTEKIFKELRENWGWV